VWTNFNPARRLGERCKLPQAEIAFGAFSYFNIVAVKSDKIANEF